MTKGYAVFDGNVPMGLNGQGHITHAYENRNDMLLFVRWKDAELWRIRLSQVGAKVWHEPFEVRETEVSE